MSEIDPTSEVQEVPKETISSPFMSDRVQKALTLFFVSVLSIYFFMIFLTHMDVGFVGENIRYYLHLFIGHIASILPFCGLYWLLERYIISAKYHNSDHSSGMVFIGFVMFVLGSSTLTTLTNIENSNGGFWGGWTAEFLLSGLGFWGAFLITVCLLVFSLSLFISVRWRMLFIATGMRVMSWEMDAKGEVIEPSEHAVLTEYPEVKKSYLINKPADNISAEKQSEEFDIKQEKFSLMGRFISFFRSFRIQKHEQIKEAPKELILDDFIHNKIEGDVEAIDIDTTIEENDEINVFPNELDVEDDPVLLVDEIDLEGSENIGSDRQLDTNQVLIEDQVEDKDKNKKENLIEKVSVAKVDKAKKQVPASAQLKTTSLPPLKLLNSDIVKVNSYTDQQLNEMGEALEKNLKNFNIDVVVKAIQPGPVVTLFEIDPAPGVKVGQIVQLAKDLARSLVVSSVRVVEVIPGKSYIGIEIPNNQREPVNFYEMLSSEKFQKQDKPLTMALGKDIGGSPVVVDLAKTPHLLVAGTTGSGKSVGINSMILSLLYKSLPSDVKLILIDPKMLELSIYEGIPHLITPVVTDMSEAAAALKWAVAEMERRYKLMSLMGVRNIIGFNEKIKQAEKDGVPIKDPMYKPKALYTLEEAEEAPVLEKMPYVVLIIDEFADLIMVVGKQIEELIARIAQKARAAGIHLILATQRPSVNVITGLIKANIPTRLSFQVSTKIDSRTILDQGGAEQLLGLGDMLYSSPGQGSPLRAHGAFVSDEEVHKTVDWLKNNHHPPVYIENLQEKTEQTNSELGIGDKAEGEDELFTAAWEVVLRTKKASISRVQRELRIGYNRAARLIEDMEQQGLLSEPDMRGNREILAGKRDED